GRHEPPFQRGRVGGGQPVPHLPGEVDHGRRPQPAVEVVVEQHLRCRADLLVRRRCHHGVTLSPRDRTACGHARTSAEVPCWPTCSPTCAARSATTASRSPARRCAARAGTRTTWPGRGTWPWPRG